MNARELANRRFAKLGISQTVEARCAYRALIVTTPRLADSISGVIFDVITSKFGLGKGRGLGRNERGRDRKSDEERLAATATLPSTGLKMSGVWPDLGRPLTSLKLLRDLQVPIR